MFQVQHCQDIRDLIERIQALAGEGQGRWVFRGERSAAWMLSSTLERELDRFRIAAVQRPVIERRMVREFRRRLHHFMAAVPGEDATDECLALMQHHGAPTRLLDFTYSPYVAAFFALERSEPGDTCAVWSVDTDWCEERLAILQPDLSQVYTQYQRDRDGPGFNELFMREDPLPMVLSLNPFRLNERLAYQKGAFLCPGDIRLGFLENLKALAGDSASEAGVVKFTLDAGPSGECRDDGLRWLFQMNIERATLFPGLDGFAQSLDTKIVTLFQGQRW